MIRSTRGATWDAYRWLELAADWLGPIYRHIRTGVMAGGYVQVDETPVPYLEPGHGTARILA